MFDGHAIGPAVLVGPDVCRPDNVAGRAASEEVTINPNQIVTFLRSGFVREELRFCPMLAAIQAHWGLVL
jgi:hypothetical protein